MDPKMQFYPEPYIRRECRNVVNVALVGDKIDLYTDGPNGYWSCEIVHIGSKKITIKTRKGKTKKIPNKNVEDFCVRKRTKMSAKMINAVDGNDDGGC